MNLSVSPAQLAEVKIEIIENAIKNKKFLTLNNGMFFKTFSQLEASQKLSTGDRIWLGRMLRESNNNKPTNNPFGLAIFQEPKQYKLVRKFK